MDGRETGDDDTLERHTDTNKLTGHTARLAADDDDDAVNARGARLGLYQGRQHRG